MMEVLFRQSHSAKQKYQESGENRFLLDDPCKRRINQTKAFVVTLLRYQRAFRTRRRFHTPCGNQQLDSVSFFPWKPSSCLRRSGYIKNSILISFAALLTVGIILSKRFYLWRKNDLVLRMHLWSKFIGLFGENSVSTWGLHTSVTAPTTRAIADSDVKFWEMGSNFW